MSSSGTKIKNRMKKRHSSLHEVERKSQVRKRLEEYRKKAEAKFKREREKMTKLSRKTRTNVLKVKKRKMSPGANLFRSAVKSQDDTSITAAMTKRLVSKSVFHKGKVTQVKTKGLSKVGKLDPKLVSKFHKLRPGEKPRRKGKKSNKKKKEQKYVQKTSFLSRTSQSFRTSSMGRWMSGRLGWKSSRGSKEMNARKIAKDLRKSNKFKKRSSKDGVYEEDVVVITEDSVLDEDTTTTKTHEEDDDDDVDYSKMLTFVTFHQAMFRRLKRIVRFNKTRLDVLNDDGEVRHRFAYKKCMMNIMTPRHVKIEFTDDEKTKTYGLFAPDATHLYFEYLRRQYGEINDQEEKDLTEEDNKSQYENNDTKMIKPFESRHLKRVPTSRKMKIYKMTGLNEMQRVDRLLRHTFYDPDTDEGRTRLHFLNTTCPITALETGEPQSLAEKINVFMIQMQNFVVKQRFQELRQVLDEDDFADDEIEDLKLPDKIRHRIRLRVEEAVYLPVRSRLSPRLLLVSSSLDDVSSSKDDDDYDDENGNNNKKNEANTSKGDVNLMSFKKFPPEHWGVEHESPSNWEEAIKHLRQMGRAQLPSEMLQEVLLAAKAVFQTFRNECEDSSELGADDFLPVHIYALAQAGDVLKDPMRRTKEMLALCHPDTLRSEAGYYLTSMESALEYLSSM